MSHIWVAIIAGGKGTRLFPISYIDRPKQFVQLDDKRTFIQATVERFRNLGISSKQIVVITTNNNQTALAKKQLIQKGIISENIYQIPEHYGYAGAMVKASEFIQNFDKHAIVINTPADQFIGNEAEFAQTLNTALENFDNSTPIIVGFKTGDLVTAMGCGHMFFKNTGRPLHKMVGKFIEKPNREQAETLIRRNDSACNTGINIWSLKALFKVVKSENIGLDGLATDALMNKFFQIMIAVGEFDWHDCGTLQAIYDVNEKNATPTHHNVMLGSGKDGIETTRCENCLLYAIRGIELDAVNIKNAAIIATNLYDHIFLAIVDLADSQRVKELAERYDEDRSLLSENFTINGKNNVCLESNLPEHDLHVGFVGTNNIYVYAHKDRNNDIRIAVVNHAGK